MPVVLICAIVLPLVIAQLMLARDFAPWDVVQAYIGSLVGPVEVDILPYNEAVLGKIGRLVGDYGLLKVEPSDGRPMEEVQQMLKSLGISARIGG